MKVSNMRKLSVNSSGFAHNIIIIGLLSVVVIGSVFVSVVKAHHKSDSKANQKIGNSSSSQSKLDTKQSTEASITPAATTNSTSASANAAPTPASKPVAVAPKTTKPSSTNSGSTTTSSQPAGRPATPAPTPAPTPLSVLTNLISNLDNGAQITITNSAVTVSGPITDAQARPIVFSLNGQSYFAYHQGSPADFNASASQTASTMAITKALGNSATVQAHLDKDGNLVDPNISGYLVAYSQGGN